jgi:monofunctional biosynthetic peptidoglycan transglycosylase
LARTPRSRLVRRAAVAAALALGLVLLGLGLLWLRLPDPAPLARENPRTTALVEQRRAEAAAAGRRFSPRLSWVPLDRVSPRLVQAVVLSEDARFFGHEGFDWESIRDAAEQGLERGRMTRGASTITQQLAKNLYLGTERTLSRKAKEALLAVKLERALSKRRILAVYLNVVEWRDGVFGVEAASRAWFGRGARDLTTAQAALLASMLPAPRKAALAPAPRWLARRSRRCVDRLLQAGKIGLAEHARAREELEGLLSGEGGGDDGDDPPPEPTREIARRAPAPSSSALEAAIGRVTQGEPAAGEPSVRRGGAPPAPPPDPADAPR